MLRLSSGSAITASSVDFVINASPVPGNPLVISTLYLSSYKLKVTYLAGLPSSESSILTSKFLELLADISLGINGASLKGA